MFLLLAHGFAGDAVINLRIIHHPRVNLEHDRQSDYPNKQKKCRR